MGCGSSRRTPFSEFELVWEPRLGDVAASADLGWLTGPSTSINHTAKDPKPGHGCYLSIWRKQPNGTWRVFIDVGAGAPEPVPFAPGFTRMPFGDRYVGKAGEAVKDAAGKSLAEADRDLNAQMAAQGASRAFASRVTPSSRLHRPGSTPIVGAEAIAVWLNVHASAAAARDGVAEAAAAGDFGYTYGTFEIKTPKPLVGRLPPALEPRRGRPLVADGRCRAAVPAVGARVIAPPTPSCVFVALRRSAARGR